MSSDNVDLTEFLPPYLNLPPHLSAHKYVFVCTLTVAVWDTLVLSPRAWRLYRTEEWPPLKLAFYLLRWLMPIEFIIVAVAFFDTHWTTEMCQKFYLFEPILTAILVSVCAAIHVVRISAIYSYNNRIAGILCTLLLLQMVVMGLACGFYRVVPVEDPSQGCIAGPEYNWVGIYWVGPSLFFSSSFALALGRSFQSRAQKPTGRWKLMLRDGLNLYGTVWIVNVLNMLFWFIITPTGPEDTIKTSVTSMTTVITITWTMRIILSVPGSLVAGGSFAGDKAEKVISASCPRGVNNPGAHRSRGVHPAISIDQPSQVYTIDNLHEDAQRNQADNADGKSSLNDGHSEIYSKP